MFQVLLLFATLAHGIRTRVHMALQVVPDATCTQWLNSAAGQEYTQCDSGNPGVPVPYNETNNCELTFTDFDNYCNNSCYGVMVKAWEFFLNTSTCLNVEQDKYKPCMNNSDCPALGNGLSRICFEGFCYNACNTTADCNACMNETCVTLGNGSGSNSSTNTNDTTGGGVNGTIGGNGTTSQQLGCRSTTQFFVNGSAAMNRTIQNTFRAQLYQLQAGCSKNANNQYCGLMDLTNQTCDSLKSQWGCCASTILPSDRYCQWINFTDPTISNLLNNCSFDTSPCGGLDWAWQFCGINGTNSTSNPPNGSSSSSSSGIIGSNSSSSSSGSSSSGSSSSNITSSTSSTSSGIVTNSSSSSGIITNSSSSSSGIITNSSSSSGIIITNSSSSSHISSSMGSMSNMSSSSHHSLISSSSGGIGTNHTNNNTASAKATISWTMTIALVLAAANVVS